MKTIIIVVLTLLTVIKTRGQHLIVASINEKTVAGWQYGGKVSFQNKKLWSVGVFYQKDLMSKSDSAPHGNTFCGLTFLAPLMRSNRINFYFNTRIGTTNQIFIAFVPGLETELKISKVFSVSTLMSVRMTYPSAAVKLNIKI